MLFTTGEPCRGLYLVVEGVATAPGLLREAGYQTMAVVSQPVTACGVTLVISWLAYVRV